LSNKFAQQKINNTVYQVTKLLSVIQAKRLSRRWFGFCRRSSTNPV